MSTLKVNELDTRSGTDITVTTGKTVVVPAGATLDVAGTATLTNATLQLPATLPATAGTNITSIPGANITGTIPLAALGNVDTTGLQDDIALLAFKTQANGSLARYNLVDQSVDAFEDASGVDASASINEVRNVSNYYEGSSGGAVTASGNYDSTAVDGAYTYYKWTTVTSSGSYTTDTAQDYEYLVVAGGAGGGSHDGGAGGAGGFRTATGFAVAATTIGSITVGAGGNGGVDTFGASGGDSSFSTITSAGGGGGGGGSANPGTVPRQGKSGGSGGGAGAYVPSGSDVAGSGNVPSTSPVQGYGGGVGYAGGGNDYEAGGGGGASAIGAAGVAGSAGNGGAGTASSITGSSVTYAGGGGGGTQNNAPSAGAGGAGGGGGGGYNAVGVAGTANTGGGGGGGGSSQSGGAGGSGIVIIRRPTTAAVEGGNMTLVSTAQTAQAQPTKGDVVLTYTNGTGTTTLDTDLIASVSRDNGTTYTAAPLTLQGTTGGHNIATAHDVVISGQPAGTSMRWKVVTANQSSGSKTTRIQAVSLGWS